MSRSTLLAVAAILATACADGTPTAPLRAPAAPSMTSSSADLVECPTDVTTRASGLIGPLGGSLSAGGTTVSFPTGALLVPGTVELVVPAGQYMEVALTVNGGDATFHTAVTISVSYARCTRSDLNKTPLSVWYIDSGSKSLLQNMGGTDDKAARRVTFTTDHFSGYAVAN